MYRSYSVFVKWYLELAVDQYEDGDGRGVNHSTRNRVLADVHRRANVRIPQKLLLNLGIA